MSRLEEFKEVCTREEAMEYFKNKGLTYSDITEGDILSLVLLLNREIKKSNKNGETSADTMHLSKKIDISKNTNGTIKYCYLYINSHYFTQREAISFCSNKYIGFAGWADHGNANPILRSFLKWCDELAEGKEQE